MQNKKLNSVLHRVVARDDKFNSEITDVTIFDDLSNELKLNPEDIIYKKVRLEWEADWVFRKYGIASLLAIVPDQTIEISGTYVNEDGDEEEFSRKLKIDDVEIEYIRPEDDIHGLELFPTEIEFYKKKWNVKFQI